MKVSFHMLAAVGACSLTAYYRLFLKRRVPDRFPNINPFAFDNSHFVTKPPKSIGIVGGGVAGAIVCKTLTQAGFSAEVLEKGPDLGGNWRANYDGVRLQAPYIHFNMPDFTFPPNTETFPERSAVHSYIRAYAKEFKILDKFTYNCDVVDVFQNKDNSWTVKLASGKEKQYDFLVLATGLHSTPHIPDIPGREEFKGTVVHSSRAYDAQALFKDKKVLVLGGNRSGWDMVHIVSKYTDQLKWAFKGMSWHVPLDETALRFNLATLIISRFGAHFIPPHEEGHTYYHWKTLRAAFKWLVRKNEAALPEVLRSMKLPSYDTSIFVREPEVVDLVKNKKITVAKGTPTHFTSTGLVVDGQHLECDVVVMCTGFESNPLVMNKDRWLYRNMVVPHRTNFAILGMHHQFWIPLYINIQSVWLANVLKGRVQLPTHQQMATISDSRKERMTSIYGPGGNREFSYSTIPLIDQLIRDMQLPVQRVPTRYEHWFGFIDPKVYDFILKWV